MRITASDSSGDCYTYDDQQGSLILMPEDKVRVAQALEDALAFLNSAQPTIPAGAMPLFAVR